MYSGRPEKANWLKLYYRIIERRSFILIALITLVSVALLFSLYERPKKPTPRDINYASVKKTSTRLYAEGRYEEAIRGLEDYLKVNADDSGVRSLVASAYHQSGDAKEAYRHYKELLELKPDDAEVLYLLALTAGHLDFSREAVVYLEGAVRNRPGSALFRAQLARAYHDQEECASALKIWGELLSDLPEGAGDRTEIYAEMARVYLHHGDQVGAGQALKSGLALDPENVELLSLMKTVSQE